jgi:hypothetical protein
VHLKLVSSRKQAQNENYHESIDLYKEEEGGDGKTLMPDQTAIALGSTTTTTTTRTGNLFWDR